MKRYIITDPCYLISDGNSVYMSEECDYEDEDDY